MRSFAPRGICTDNRAVIRPVQRFAVVSLLAFVILPATPRAAPAPATEIFYADPTIVSENGRYYLTGTRSGEPAGFALLQSDNLREWRPAVSASAGLILRRGDGVYGTANFWAPQIFHNGANYFLTYTANEHVALARSAALTGPYRQDTVRPIDGAERNIDSYVFHDDDGKYYLYHVRFRRGNFIWVAEFDPETGRLKPETLRQCFGRSQPWEATAAYSSPPIMEGPAVLKLRGKYYLLYSANHYRSIDYAVGYAVADSPLGPWVKPDHNPILHRSIVGENGSGHGDVFRNAQGALFYVYHVHHSDTSVSPRRTRIVPLVLRWNESASRFDLAVDATHIIKPLVATPAEH